MELVVVNPFGDRRVGDVVTNPAEVEKILASHPSHVVKRTAASPAPAPKAEG